MPEYTCTASDAVLTAADVHDCLEPARGTATL
jgi:hypothetical protein